MPEHSKPPKPTELIRLHVATCLAMTEFINGHHCPKLAHFIVHQLSRLIDHPELGQASPSRDMYQQLLGHWQKVTAQLLAQQKSRKATPCYH